MKKYISVILTFVIVVSGMHIQPAAAQATSAQKVYSESYGSQLADEDDNGLSMKIYEQLVESYTYQDGTYAGLAKPLPEGTEIDMGTVISKEFASFDEAKAYDWKANEGHTVNRACSAAYDAFMKDYPQVYWLYGSAWGVSWAVMGTHAEIGLALNPKEYVDGSIQYIEVFNDAVRNSEQYIRSNYNISGNTKTEEIVKILHDYVAEQVDYNYDAVNNFDSKESHYAHTPLAVFLPDGEEWGNKVVCEGYAKAFKILCDRFGVECALIIGQSLNNEGNFENHMWNAVEIKDKWYGVDVTWDDQENQIYDTYLLAGEGSEGFSGKTFKEDHIAYNTFSDSDYVKEFILPQISEKGFGQGEEMTTPNGSNLGETTTPNGTNPINPGETTTPNGTNPINPGETTTPNGSNPVKPGDTTTTLNDSNPVKPGEATTPNTGKTEETTTSNTGQQEGTTENKVNTSVAKTKVKKVTKKLASKKAKISLKKISGAKYEVKISTTKKFKKKNTVTKNVKKATFTVKSKKIKGKKVLYVKARAYKVVDKKNYYGKWSKTKKIKFKK